MPIWKTTSHHYFPEGLFWHPTPMGCLAISATKDCKVCACVCVCVCPVLVGLDFRGRPPRSIFSKLAKTSDHYALHRPSHTPPRETPKIQRERRPRAWHSRRAKKCKWKMEAGHRSVFAPPSAPSKKRRKNKHPAKQGLLSHILFFPQPAKPQSKLFSQSDSAAVPKVHHYEGCFPSSKSRYPAPHLAVMELSNHGLSLQETFGNLTNSPPIRIQNLRVEHLQKAATPSVG